MIIGKIIGGLGNQMFQYTFYKYLSIDKKVDLKLDLSSFENYHLHNGYELENVFDVGEFMATQDEIKKYKSKVPLFFKIENKFLNKNIIFGKSHIRENKFQINLKIFDDDFDDFYVEGYFQTYKYIQQIDNKIFKFKTKLDNREHDVFTGDTVAIHIRGGDYITNKADKKLFGNICTSEYYKNAIRYMKEHLKASKFIVFTNDTAYAMEVLKGESFMLVDWNMGKNSFRDMFLMTQCRHNIIANSSFSWWGAWLNNNPDKIVVAPMRWFNNKNINQTNIIPLNWIRLES